MLLELEMGYKRNTVTVTWNKALDDFPHFLKYQGDPYEWVVYDTGVYPVDFVLRYAEIPPYDPNYWKATEKLEDMMGTRAANKDCECGAVHTSFPNHHLFYCPLWRRGP